MAGQKYPKGRTKVKKVMDEYGSGTLKSSSGQKVTKRTQAVAIGLSEQRALEKKKAAEKRRRSRKTSGA